jgi:hypothetical protein
MHLLRIYPWKIFLSMNALMSVIRRELLNYKSVCPASLTLKTVKYSELYEYSLRIRWEISLTICKFVAMKSGNVHV